MKIVKHIHGTLHNRRAQLLLPAVLMFPLFVLVMYLLFETTKVSMIKMRHQFALDNAAYAQMSTVATFLNAVAKTNGPLPSRALKMNSQKLKPVNEANLYRESNQWTVFDLFFQAGAVNTVGPDYDKNAIHNPNPKAESTDWGIHYAKYDGIEAFVDEDNNPIYDRSGWEKETPEPIKGPVYVMHKEMVDKHYVASKQVGIPAISQYINTYIQTGDIYNLQKHTYEKTTKHAEIFRNGYYLNVKDCKPSECARQSASRLLPLLSIPTKRQEADDLVFYISASDMAGGSGGAIKLDLKISEIVSGADPVFLFAYVLPAGRRNLRTLQRGVMLKQNFPLGENNFNVDLTSKYKPYVRTTIVLSCPRANNNCVWPNPLSKYSIRLRP